MNNVLYAILPFLLFGFVSEILLKGRFSRRLNLIIYNAVLSAEIKRQIEYRTESGDSYYGYGIFTSPEDMENAFDSPHRTYIVNMNYVSGVQGYELIVADTVMPISKSAYRKFKENYIRYCFEK